MSETSKSVTMATAEANAAHAVQPNLVLAGIRRAFPQPDGALEVLRGCDATILPGELVAMVGTSGCGKSTLLQICGLLDNPSSGTLEIAGQAVETLGDRARTRLRRGTVGFIYQFHHLLPEFTALENVITPVGRRRRAGEAQERAKCCSSAWVWGTVWAIAPANCPAGRSSGLPLPAPSPAGQPCYWQTNRPATSTLTRRSRSLPCSSS